MGTKEESAELMTADEVARYLKLSSRRAVYQAVRRGELTVYRLGRRIRFRRTDLDRALVRSESFPSRQDGDKLGECGNALPEEGGEEDGR